MTEETNDFHVICSSLPLSTIYICLN